MAQTEQEPVVSADQTQSPTFVEIILDETGSMQAGPTIAGFNGFIEDQKSIEGACYLTLTKFDSNGIRTPYRNLSIQSVPPLSFFPGSMTNLYDVVGQRLHEVVGLKGRRLMVVITDGADNQSRSYTASKVAELVSQARSEGISLLYFGADANAASIGRQMGFRDGEITVFKATDIEQTMAVVSSSTRAFRVG